MAEAERTEPSMVKRNAVKDYKYLWYMGTVYYDIDARTAGRIGDNLDYNLMSQ